MVSDQLLGFRPDEIITLDDVMASDAANGNSGWESATTVWSLAMVAWLVVLPTFVSAEPQASDFCGQDSLVTTAGRSGRDARCRITLTRLARFCERCEEVPRFRREPG